MEISSLEAEKIIKVVRSLVRLRKEIDDTAIKDIRKLFRLQKENKGNKDIILREITHLFENKEEENYYKPVKVSNFWSKNYIEFESNGDRNKTPSVEEYLNKVRPY